MFRLSRRAVSAVAMIDRPVPSLRDRYLGAMVGLSAGDALGTTVEFMSPGTFAPVTDIVGGGPFGLAPGQWTDDTSMALCLAESLVERSGFDGRDQLRRAYGSEFAIDVADTRRISASSACSFSVCLLSSPARSIGMVLTTTAPALVAASHAATSAAQRSLPSCAGFS